MSTFIDMTFRYKLLSWFRRKFLKIRDTHILDAHLDLQQFITIYQDYNKLQAEPFRIINTKKNDSIPNFSYAHAVSDIFKNRRELERRVRVVEESVYFGLEDVHKLTDEMKDIVVKMRSIVSQLKSLHEDVEPSQDTSGVST